MTGDEDTSFSIYNLEISVHGEVDTFVCSHDPNTRIRVVGENLYFENGIPFSMYTLASLIPLLPVKQRETHPNDWISTDELIACPDPHCGAKFKITRVDKTSFRHEDVTKVPLPNDQENKE